jgi:hypothetical protein
VLDFKKIKTYPLKLRQNLHDLSTFVCDTKDFTPWGNRKFHALVRKVVQAHRNGHGVVVQIGAHVVKTGQSPLLIDLMKRGVITHLAMNGAAAIHDFEIALQGATAESVAVNIENGMFGMWEETGRMMNQAINRSNEGFGKTIGRLIVRKKMPHADYSLLAAAFRLKIPATVHVAIGTDIIHQHPLCDGAATGRATFEDFKLYTESIAHLSGGCFLNFGSAVIGPEVFLKALSISRNLGYPVAPLTTANFDCRPGITHYYYRPAKNIVLRPVSTGGQGYNFLVDHRVSVPSFHRLVIEMMEAKGNGA